MEMNLQLARLPAVMAAQETALAARDLDALNAAIRSYAAHPIATASPAVLGRYGDKAGGNPVMLLGKSPGTIETQTGRPFQGPAAQVLRQSITEAGHDIEEVYQTQATYWLPRKGTSPNATQLAFSYPFLAREIEMVRPRLIIALGAQVLDSLFGDHPDMDTISGSIADYKGIPVHRLRNHSYINHFPGERPAFVAALRAALG